MKSKIDIQRGWKNWVRDLASVSGFPAEYTGDVMIEMGKEVEWALRTSDLESAIDGRLDKVDILLDATDGDLHGFDEYWQIRSQLWGWMKA